MSTDKIRISPLGDKVVVEPISELERGSKTKGGIFIPETADKERSEQGTVVAVGPGKITDEGQRLPMTVKVGQKERCTKYGPDEIKVAGKQSLSLSESNILAVIEN